MEHAAVDIRRSSGFKLTAYVAGNLLDISLQPVNVSENPVVDALEHISWLGKVCVVYQSVAQRADVAGRRGKAESP